MRFKVYIFLFVGCFGILKLHAQTSPDNVVKFYAYFGEGQAQALKSAVKSLDTFLDQNFKGNEEEQIVAFLEYIKEEHGPDSTWKYNTTNDSLIIFSFEKSGLRKEFWLYGYEIDTLVEDEKVLNFYRPVNADSLEIYDVAEDQLEEILLELEKSLEDFDDLEQNDSLVNYQIEQDSIRHRDMKIENWESKIPYALYKFNDGDTLIMNYVDVKQQVGTILSYLLADGLLRSDHKGYQSEFFKIILVTEFYYYAMLSNLYNQGVNLYPND
ncbi:MAG: hypothetical protein KDD41_10470 [Flavobacteriales bacterium]|nr:hypothetical protein [Flavobacteriales bacterium]